MRSDTFENESSSGKRRSNRLENETSLYLRQHAKNPVDWYPWGEEAFHRALSEDKPIFLSIGYSSCHWCHVMEEESFEDEGVAKLLNDNFVAIKVDREERPDVDSTYLIAAQLLTGTAGWPLTIIMTPDKRPFFAATYLPREGNMGLLGLTNILPTIAEYWKKRRKELESSADSIVEAMVSRTEHEKNIGVGEDTLHQAFMSLMTAFDEKYAGFGLVQKFPTPNRLMFLLRYWDRTDEKLALWMPDRTLEVMRAGGIFDQLEGGFHRYSTDQMWLLPHFEKMLYDQALISISCLEAYLATGKEIHARTATEVLDYVLSRMTSPDGGFYSSEDADSEGEEGRFYLWTVDEVRKVLTEEEAAAAIRSFGLREEGNYLERGARPSGKNVLHLVEIDQALKIIDSEIFQRIRTKLMIARATRTRPARDEKMLTDWNSLMITAFCRASRVLSKRSYLDAAVRASEHLLNNMIGRDGRLLHVHGKDDEGSEGFLDDHTFMVGAMLDMYEATFETRYLKKALEVMERTIDLFWDEKEGGFFLTSRTAEDILVRKKDIYDGAVPSGNSFAAMDLIRLWRFTGNERFRKLFLEMMDAFGAELAGSPENHAYSIMALDFSIGPSYDVVISGEQDDVGVESMMRELDRHFVPNLVVLLQPGGALGEEIEKLTPIVTGKEMIDGHATAHICSDKACLPPITDPKRFSDLFKEQVR